MIADDLREGRAIAAVWGGGFVGFSSAASLAREGVRTVVYDINPEVVDAIGQGRCPVPGLRDWLGFDPAPLVEAGLLRAVHIPSGVEDGHRLHAGAHFVAVPTERDGEPHLDALWDVLSRIRLDAGPRQALVVIESTVVPGTSYAVARILADRPNLLMAVAPRRDWFCDAAHTLRTLPRVYAGFDGAAADEADAVLSLLCDQRVRAPGVREAELTKALENADRHMRITLCNQIAQAFDGIDADELFELAATKWNFGEAWKAGIGIGGYCLPVAPRYLLAGADHPEALTLLAEAMEWDQGLPGTIAGAFLRAGHDSVTVLGLTYRPDLAVTQQSAAIALCKAMMLAGIRVSVHDPLLTQTQMGSLVPGARILESIDQEWFISEAVILAVGHRAYRTLAPSMVTALLDSTHCRLLLDVGRIWDVPMPIGCIRLTPGQPGWLSFGRHQDHQP